MNNFACVDAFALLRSYSRHRDFVRLALTRIAHVLECRAIEHDASKMRDDEFAGFARISQTSRLHPFGSEEYKEALARERETISLHFSRNRHHSERPILLGEAAERERGLPDDATYWHARDANRMTFIDVIEMVCDWWGARQGYGDSNLPWKETVRINLESKAKNLSPEQYWLAQEVAEFFSDDPAN
jgi:hypothetical protein